MKRFLILIMALAISAVSFTSCHSVEPGAGQEAVLTHQPWLFGHGGVDMAPVSTGLKWVWVTTHATIFPIIPVKHEERLEDIISNENTPLDFNTMISLQIIEGKSPVLMKNYGIDWYENNIKDYYNNRTRDYVSQYSPFELTSNRDVIAHIDSCVFQDMVNYIDRLSQIKELPIRVCNVITGRAIPNPEQAKEMNNTAAQIQAKQTQERRVEMEAAREKAERQRAIADKAYQREMGLTAEQFIQLKAWDVIQAKQGANIDVMFGSAPNSMWNIRR